MTMLSMAISLFVFCVVGFIIYFVQCSPIPGQWLHRCLEFNFCGFSWFYYLGAPRELPPDTYA